MRCDSSILVREQPYSPDYQRAEKSKHRALGEIVPGRVIRKFRHPCCCQQCAERDEDFQWIEEDNRPQNQYREIVCVSRADLRLAEPFVIVDRDVLYVVIVARRGERDCRRERKAGREKVKVLLDKTLPDQSQARIQIGQLVPREIARQPAEKCLRRSTLE